MIDTYGIIVGIVSLLPLLILQFKGKFIYFAIATIIAMALHGSYLFGPHILYLLLLTYVISTIAELVSLKTPLRCFGVKYWYDLNNPLFSSKIRLLNIYPLEVSFAWVIVKYLAFNLALLITQAFLLPQLSVIFLTPLILVSLDFIIDPVSVTINKLWQWEKGSAYFGIPLRNFLGWYLVGLLVTFLFSYSNQGRQVTFSVLYLLPIIFYSSFIKEALSLFKINKKMAVIGSIPTIMWSLLSSISLLILYFR